MLAEISIRSKANLRRSKPAFDENCFHESREFYFKLHFFRGHTAVNSSPKIGEMVYVPWLDHGKYVIGKVMSGGMGSVYQLVPTKPVNPTLAAKTLQSTASPEQFRRECEMWISLSSHRFVAQAIAYGELFGAPCVVARWYPESLCQHPLRSWSSDSIRRFIANLLDALEFTSTKHGVIHQDIKPANILIDSEGNPALADFGVARLAPHRPAQLEGSPLRMSRATLNANGIGGTPFYMAPELLARRALPSIRTDVFSLGVTLFESLTGQHPYFNRDGDIAHAPRLEELSQCLDAHGAFGSSLKQSIGTMLALDPATRPSSYLSLKKNLDLICRATEAHLVDSPTSTVALVMLLRTQGRMPEAMRVIEDALRGEPDNPVLLNSQGILAIAMRDQVKAIDAFSKAMRTLVRSNGRLDSSLPMPYCDPGVNLGWQFIVSERFAAAEECLGQVWNWINECEVQRLAAQYPAMGWLLLYRGQFDAACVFFQELSRHHQLNYESLSWWTLAAYFGNQSADSFAVAGECFHKLAPWTMDQALVACLLASRAPASASTKLLQNAADDAGPHLAAAERKFGLHPGALVMPLSLGAQRDIAQSIDHNWTGGKHNGTT